MPRRCAVLDGALVQSLGEAAWAKKRGGLRRLALSGSAGMAKESRPYSKNRMRFAGLIMQNFSILAAESTARNKIPILRNSLWIPYDFLAFIDSPEEKIPRACRTGGPHKSRVARHQEPGFSPA